MKIVVVCTVFLFLCACSSDPKESSEENFKNALQTQFSVNKECFTINAVFPYEVVSASSSYRSKASVLNELVAVGLLTSSEESVEKRTLLTGRRTGTMKPGYIFTLTDHGEEAVVLSKGNVLTGAQSQFCYGHFEVSSIDSFTEPAESNGQLISKVKFSYKAGDVADWAKDSQIFSKGFPKLAKFLASSKEPLKGDAVLVLTNKGWVPQKKVALW